MISDNWGLVKDLMIGDEHLGQKVYQIEKEVTYVVKTLVIAKNDDDAFNKYLNETETRDCEGYNAPNNSLFLYVIHYATSLTMLIGFVACRHLLPFLFGSAFKSQ